MTVKEQLIELVRKEGFDFMTACKVVSKILDEVKAKKPGNYRYEIGKTSFTLRKEENLRIVKKEKKKKWKSTEKNIKIF